MDIVFIQPPFWGTTTPPLGLASMKAMANELGLETKCLDLNIELYQWAGKKYGKYWHLAEGYGPCEDQEEVLSFYKDFHHLILVYRKRLVELKPKEIWISVQNSSSLFTSLLIRELNGISDIYLGGPQIWQFEQEGIDTKEIFPESNGYCLSEGESFFRSEMESFAKDLDKLPFPDFRDFDLDKYDYSDSLPIYFSRGCINKCIFCSERGLHGGVYRYRSGWRVFNDLRHQLLMHPDVFFFHFHDSVSNGNIKELINFCDLMIDNGLGKKIKWSMGNATIRKEMRKPLYEKMKKAGCTFIGYGLETPIPRLLKEIGKNSAVGTDIEAIVREAYEVGMKVNLNFMFGLPGETVSDFEGTIDFLRHNKDYIYQVNPALNLCGFFPGSKGYNYPNECGIKLGANPLLWQDKETDYSIRKFRFIQFTNEAKHLGIKNFFGEVKKPAFPWKENLFYGSETQLPTGDRQSILWFLGRLWANFWFLLTRDIKGTVRKWHYTRVGRNS